MDMEPNDRVTLRLDKEMLRRVEAYIDEHGFESRSQLLRSALEAYMAGVTADDRVAVRIPARFLGLIDHLVDEGHFLSREDALVYCVRSTLSKEKVTEIRDHHHAIGKMTGRTIDVQDEVLGS